MIRPLAATAAVVAALTFTGGPPANAALSHQMKVNTWQHTEADYLTSSRIQIIPGGTFVPIICYSRSPAYPVHGDNVYYLTTYRSKTGYVAGYYVNTGGIDPAPGIDPC